MKKFTLTNDEIGSVCQELSFLLHAGIRTADALTLLAGDEERPRLKEVLDAMGKKTDGGATLSDAFLQAGCFPDYVCGMVSAGESSGRVEEALNALADSCGKRAALDRRLRSALLYPSVLLLIMLAVIAVLLIYVLPIFNDVYAQLGSGLTGVAGGLLAFGQVLSAAAPVLLGVFAAAVLALCLFSASESLRNRLLSAWQNRSGEGRLSGKLNRARFAQALSMCVGSGMPLDKAIRQAAKLMPDSPPMAARCGECLKLLDDGAELAAALQSSGLLPGAECRMLEAGVRGGSGERAMEQISRRMTEDSDAAIDESVSRVEPTMVIITSILVGFILLSVMLPLINIMSAIA